jgi:2-oxoisovalerate dehydrogenase E1 component
MQFNRKQLTDDKLIDIYKHLLRPRLIEEKMLILLRQNKISKWFSGIGQEAISVGATLALDDDEYILPMHRNLGVFTSRQIPLNRLFSQFQGKMDGFTKGRDRSFHFGTNDYHIVGMISHLGPQLGVADGIALANKLANNGKSTLVFSGDGGSSEGDFHESLNVAAVWDLPVIFMIENNGYGLSTPSNEQYKFKNFIDKGPGYGMKAVNIDGNNVLEVYHAVAEAKKQINKKPHPILMEAMTFRMRGHEEASGTKYVPQELFDEWAKKDPLVNYEGYLLKESVVTAAQVSDFRARIKEEINEGLALAAQDTYPLVNTEEQEADLFKPYQQEVIEPAGKTTTKRFVDAISDGLKQSLEKYPELIIMGQDVAEYGGVFKITEGFVEKFGKERIRNTPLCESAIVGVGLGLSIKKQKALVEMQFADFVTCGFNQIVNNLAKSHYRWSQNADVVIRMPTGAGVGAGPFHSQSNEAWFFHTPGLRVVYPSNPSEAKGLLNAAIADPNPVMYFEHKVLYRSISEEVADSYYTTEIGKAKVVVSGNDITLVTYGMGVLWAKEIIENDFAEASIELIDLRTLLPWDKEAVAKSVKKTGKVFIFHEDCITGSISGEIAAWVGENCFAYLDAPVMREGSLDTPVPFNSELEKNFLPKERIRAKIMALLNF